MSDDLYIEEEEQSEEESSSNRPFAIIAGVMGLLLVIGIICVAVLLLGRSGDGVLASLFGDGGEGDVTITQTVEARLTENAAIATQNFFVTQTLIAIATEDARPTETATPAPTDTPAPTETPMPTNTRVIDDESDGEATEEVPPSPTVGLFITQTPGSTAGGGTGTGGGDGTLPQTGLGLTGLIAAALGLLGLGLIARRLRT